MMIAILFNLFGNPLRRDMRTLACRDGVLAKEFPPCIECGKEEAAASTGARKQQQARRLTAFHRYKEKNQKRQRHDRKHQQENRMPPLEASGVVRGKTQD